MDIKEPSVYVMQVTRQELRILGLALAHNTLRGKDRFDALELNEALLKQRLRALECDVELVRKALAKSREASLAAAEGPDDADLADGATG